MKKIIFNVLNQKLKNQVGIFEEMLRNEINENLEEVKNVNTYHKTLNAEFSNLLKRDNTIQAVFGPSDRF
ncbi:MAG: hypothetical protein DHS20C18_41900 [Saprospiraceae bacterium]|nr:MAG: hypothetical protein DHS20C18_41900 [Saprospiraceae bacterium]